MMEEEFLESNSILAYKSINKKQTKKQKDKYRI